MDDTRRILRWAALALTAGAVALAVVLLTGDDDSPEAATQIVQAGAPGEASRQLSEEEAAGIEPPTPTTADVTFAQGMIHHHAQGVQMTEYVRARSVGRDLPLLAKRMRVTQQSEIELMEQWLRERGGHEPDASEHAHHTGAELMPGMLTERELARLEAGRGKRFNRLFLTYMIRHHQGALTMIRDLHAQGGGLEPELDNLVRHIDADQSIEINRMRELLGRG